MNQLVGEKSTGITGESKGYPAALQLHMDAMLMVDVLSVSLEET